MNAFQESEFSDPSWAAQLEKAMREHPAEPSSPPPRSRDDYLALLREKPDGKQIVERLSAAGDFVSLNIHNMWRQRGFFADFHGVVQQGNSWGMVAYVNHAPLPTRLENPGIQVGGFPSGTQFGVHIDFDNVATLSIWVHEGSWISMGNIPAGLLPYYKFTRTKEDYPTPTLYFAVIDHSIKVRAVNITQLE